MQVFRASCGAGRIRNGYLRPLQSVAVDALQQKPAMSVRIKIKVAWWFTWLYMPGLYTMVAMGCQPDMKKVGKTIERALTVKIEMIPGIEA